jgi:hypothetical protein
MYYFKNVTLQNESRWPLRNTKAIIFIWHTAVMENVLNCTRSPWNIRSKNTYHTDEAKPMLFLALFAQQPPGESGRL